MSFHGKKVISAFGQHRRLDGGFVGMRRGLVRHDQHGHRAARDDDARHAEQEVGVRDVLMQRYSSLNSSVALNGARSDMKPMVEFWPHRG